MGSSEKPTVRAAAKARALREEGEISRAGRFLFVFCALLIAIIAALIINLYFGFQWKSVYPQARFGWGHYTEIPMLEKPPNPAYKLFSFRSPIQPAERAPPGARATPVLFIPGNAGTARQSNALATASYALWNPNGPFHSLKRPLDVYAIDFDHETSAFHANLLKMEAHFINQALSRILSLYDRFPEPPSEVIVIAHSMGGISARGAFLEPNFVPGIVRTLFSFSTPHMSNPIPIEPSMSRYYVDVNTFWSSNHSILNDVALITLAGGIHDSMVPAALCHTRPLLGVKTWTFLAPGVPQVWQAGNHLNIMYTDRIVKKVNSFIANSVGATLEERSKLVHEYFESEIPSKLGLVSKTVERRELSLSPPDEKMKLISRALSFVRTDQKSLIHGLVTSDYNFNVSLFRNRGRGDFAFCSSFGPTRVSVLGWNGVVWLDLSEYLFSVPAPRDMSRPDYPTEWIQPEYPFLESVMYLSKADLEPFSILRVSISRGNPHSFGLMQWFASDSSTNFHRFRGIGLPFFPRKVVLKSGHGMITRFDFSRIESKNFAQKVSLTPIECSAFAVFPPVSYHFAPRLPEEVFHPNVSSEYPARLALHFSQLPGTIVNFFLFSSPQCSYEVAVELDLIQTLIEHARSYCTFFIPPMIFCPVFVLLLQLFYWEKRGRVPTFLSALATASVFALPFLFALSCFISLAVHHVPQLPAFSMFHAPLLSRIASMDDVQLHDNPLPSFMPFYLYCAGVLGALLVISGVKLMSICVWLVHVPAQVIFSRAARIIGRGSFAALLSCLCLIVSLCYPYFALILLLLFFVGRLTFAEWDWAKNVEASANPMEGLNQLRLKFTVVAMVYAVFLNKITVVSVAVRTFPSVKGTWEAEAFLWILPLFCVLELFSVANFSKRGISWVRYAIIVASVYFLLTCFNLLYRIVYVVSFVCFSLSVQASVVHFEPLWRAQLRRKAV